MAALVVALTVIGIAMATSSPPGAPRGGLSIYVKTLHAKIAEPALENDVLERALGKAGRPSAKR